MGRGLDVGTREEAAGLQIDKCVAYERTFAASYDQIFDIVRYATLCCTTYTIVF